MKKLIFLAALVALCFTIQVSAPVLVWAQGVGLRCDTPRCNYQRFDRGGHWLSEGRHDPSPYGYGGYAPDYYPGTAQGQGGINIMNPTPGTSLKVRRKNGGFLCSLFNFCDEEAIDFSTAPAAGQQTQAKPQAQQGAYTTLAPSELKEETLP